MTTSRLMQWRRGRTLLAAGLSAGAAIALMAGPIAVPAAAAPSVPKPSAAATPPASPSGGAANSAPGLITWAVQPSSAQGPDRRSTFTYNELKPGTVVHDYVGVTNYSKVPVTFQVYATDAFETSTGTLDLLSANTKPTDVGSWVTLLKSAITVPPSARVNLPFTLVVPANASPGDHAGGIIASVSLASTDSAGAKVTVDRRLAVPLFLRVSGLLRPGLTVESVSTSGFHGTVNPFGGGHTTISYTITNTGNIRLNATQLLTVTGPFGISLATRHPNNLADLLPGASVRVTQDVSDVFPVGPLSARVLLKPSEVVGLPASGKVAAAASHSASLWATPWPQLLLLVIVVGLVVGARWWLRRRRLQRESVLAAAVAQARRETAAELSRSKKVSAGDRGASV